MKIVVFEHEPWMESRIANQLPGEEVVFCREPLSVKNASIYSDADAVSVFVYSIVDKKVIDTFSKLKLIAARSTGFDHIDTKYASQKNIITTNVPKYGSTTVAEHTWALILSLSRQIAQSYERTEQINFDLAGLRGFDLHGKTLGIVGLGEIGKNVAMMSRGFNMKLRIFNRSRDEELIRKFENAVFVDKVEDVFTHSDVITFHVPLMKETHHLLNTNNYHFLKKGCIVINTARGGIIETKALVKALQEDIVRGAGLDVIESESLIVNQNTQDLDQLPSEQELSETFMNHMLLGMKNVIITPHNAFNSDESIQRLLDCNIQNIKDFFDDNRQSLNTV